MELSIMEFESFFETVPTSLDKINFKNQLKSIKHILLKPNIVTKDKHPITTHPKMCESIIKYIRDITDAEILIGDGCGVPEYNTLEAFECLGYNYLENKYNIKLIDLNELPARQFKNPSCKIHREMYLPQIIKTHYIISVPVLKVHSLAQITCSLKNMMGFLPPKHYKGVHGYWNKAVFHKNIHESIIDLNKYINPDLTVLDASIGMAEYHLGGPTCNPPINKIVAGYKAKEVDRVGAELLGLDWRNIPHLI